MDEHRAPTSNDDGEMPRPGPSRKSALHCSSRTALNRRGVSATQTAKTPSPGLTRCTNGLQAWLATAAKPKTDAASPSAHSRIPAPKVGHQKPNGSSGDGAPFGLLRCPTPLEPSPRIQGDREWDKQSRAFSRHPLRSAAPIHFLQIATIQGPASSARI